MAAPVIEAPLQTLARELAQFQSERNVAPPPPSVNVRPEVPSLEVQTREVEPPTASQQIASRSREVGGNVDVLA